MKGTGLGGRRGDEIETFTKSLLPTEVPTVLLEGAPGVCLGI